MRTRVIELTHTRLRASRLELALRQSSPAVIARIVDDKIVIDLRTIAESEESELLEVLATLA